MAEENGEMEVVLEEVENDEQDDLLYPANGEGEVNQGQPVFLLEADNGTEQEPKDLTDFGIQVSVEFLESLGLGHYRDKIENDRIGIESLVNMDFEALGAYIEDAKDRALIIGRAAKEFVRASPPRIDGRPVQVMVKCGIARISEINTVDLTARIKLFIDLYWHDYRMIGARKDQVPNYIWVPDAYVYNCTQRTGENGGKLNLHPVSLMDSETGLLLNALEVEVVLTNEMNLRDFPFDSDDLRMSILQSEDSNSAEWVFVPWQGQGGVENSVKCFYDIFDTPEFEIKGFSLDFYRNLSGGNGVSYGSFNLFIHMARRPYYYIRNMVIPIMLTTTLAFTAFFYEITELEERNNGTATTFLTTVAFLYVITSSLPKTNYTTSINISVVFSFVVQLVIWALSNLNFIVAQSDPQLALDVDFYAAIILPSIYYVATLALFLPKLAKWHYDTFDTKPPKRQLEVNLGGAARDFRLPVFESHTDTTAMLSYFPFRAGQNVFY